MTDIVCCVEEHRQRLDSSICKFLQVVIEWQHKLHEIQKNRMRPKRYFLRIIFQLFSLLLFQRTIKVLRFSADSHCKGRDQPIVTNAKFIPDFAWAV